VGHDIRDRRIERLEARDGPAQLLEDGFGRYWRWASSPNTYSP